MREVTALYTNQQRKLKVPRIQFTFFCMMIPGK